MLGCHGLVTSRSAARAAMGRRRPLHLGIRVLWLALLVGLRHVRHSEVLFRGSLTWAWVGMVLPGDLLGGDRITCRKRLLHRFVKQLILAGAGRPSG